MMATREAYQMVGALIVAGLLVLGIIGIGAYYLYKKGYFDKYISRYLENPQTSENYQENYEYSDKVENVRGKMTILGWYKEETSLGTVATIRLGETVSLKVKFENFSGKIVKVEIRKDYKNSSDVAFYSENAVLTSENQVVSVKFTPDEPVNGLREYFPAIYIEGIKVDYPNCDGPNARPRLFVENKVVPPPIIQTVYWKFGDNVNKYLTVYTNSTVDILLQVSASEETKAGIKAEVRKEISGGSDIVVKSFPLTQYNLKEGINQVNIGSFTPNETGKYFVRAGIGEEWTYDPIDPNQRPTLTVIENIVPPTVSYGYIKFGYDSKKSDVITVPQNTKVYVYFGLYVNNAGTGGDVNLKGIVKKDGTTVATFTQMVSISRADTGITKEVYMGEFVASEVTSSGYYCEYYINNTLIKYPGYDNPSVRPRVIVVSTKPTVQYGYIKFASGSQKAEQITVVQGASVDVYFGLNVVSAPYGGTVVLKCDVRKDIVNATDQSYQVFTQTVSIGVNETGIKEIKMGTFVANDVTGVNNFREYFCDYYIDGVKQNYPNSSNPDLRPYVKVNPLNIPPTVSYGYIKFESGGTKGDRIYVQVGSQVNVYFGLYVNNAGTGGTIALKCDVRKDIVNATDQSYQVFTQNVTISPNDTGTTKEIKMGTFTANDVTGVNNFRQYFCDYYINNNKISYPNSSNPDARPCVYVNAPSASAQFTISTASDGTKYGWVYWSFYALDGSYYPGPAVRDSAKSGTPIYVFARLANTSVARVSFNVELWKDIKDGKSDIKFASFTVTTTTCRSTKTSSELFGAPWNCSVGDTYYSGTYTWVYCGSFIASDKTDVNSFRSYYAKMKDVSSSSWIGDGLDWTKRPAMFTDIPVTKLGLATLEVVK